MKKHLTLVEEAQHRADFRALTEDQREVNEKTYVSIMESIKDVSQPETKTHSLEEMLDWIDGVVGGISE